MDNNPKPNEALDQNVSVTSAPDTINTQMQSDQEISSTPVTEAPIVPEQNIAPEESTVIPEQNIIPAAPPVPPKQKKGGKIGLILGLILVLIIAAGAVYYFVFFKQSGVKTFTGIVDTLYAPLDDAFKELKEQNITNNSVYFEMDGTLTTDVSNLKEFNGYTASLSGGIDTRTDEMVGALKLNGENKELFNILFNYVDDTAYAALGKAYDKALIIDDEDFSIDFDTIEKELTNYNIEDIDFILSNIKNIFNNSFKEDMFEVGFEKVAIGSSSSFAKKIDLEINENTLSNITSSFIDGINANDELVSKLVSLIRESDSEYTSQDLKESLDELKKGIMDSYEEPINITIYTNLLGTKIIKIKIASDDNEIVYENYKDRLYFSANDELVLTGKRENGITNIVVTANDEEIANLKVKTYTDEEIDLDYVLYYSDYDYWEDEYITEEITGSLKITSKKDKAELKITVNYNDYDFSYEMDLKGNNNNQEGTYKVSIAYENESILVNGNIKLTTGETLEKFDTIGAKKVSTLTDAEINSIIDNFKNQIAGTSLYDLIEDTLDDYYTSDDTTLTKPVYETY